MRNRVRDILMDQRARDAGPKPRASRAELSKVALTIAVLLLVLWAYSENEARRGRPEPLDDVERGTVQLMVKKLGMSAAEAEQRVIAMRPTAAEVESRRAERRRREAQTQKLRDAISAQYPH